MYSKKSQSELIENKDYNMVLLLPHNATKIKYFSKSFSIRFFLLVIKEYYVFLKVAANGKAFVQGGLDSTTVSTRTKANRKHKSFKLARLPALPQMQCCVPFVLSRTYL